MGQHCSLLAPTIFVPRSNMNLNLKILSRLQLFLRKHFARDWLDCLPRIAVQAIPYITRLTNPLCANSQLGSSQVKLCLRGKEHRLMNFNDAYDHSKWKQTRKAGQFINPMKTTPRILTWYFVCGSIAVKLISCVNNLNYPF